jgi:hypothetical protein
MPTGTWRRRLPLPPTPGTVVVQPIGEATPEEFAAYAAGRERAETGNNTEENTMWNKVKRALSYCNYCGSSSGHESWCSAR